MSQPPSPATSGRVALVSGGSRGIGAATVRRLAADGWDIGFGYIDDGTAAREVEKDAWELGVRVAGTDVDMTDADEISSWFELTEAQFGPVQAVVCCAGLTWEHPPPRVAAAEWRTLIDTSLHGVFHLGRTAMSAMVERREGRILAVSSVCGEYDHAADGHGMFVRPGIAGFTRELANQGRRFGITVNAVTPGPAGPARYAGVLAPEHARPDLAETIALRRFGSAAQVADLVASLLRADRPEVTGRVIEVPPGLAFLRRPGAWRDGIARWNKYAWPPRPTCPRSRRWSPPPTPGTWTGWTARPPRCWPTTPPRWRPAGSGLPASR